MRKSIFKKVFSLFSLSFVTFTTVSASDLTLNELFFDEGLSKSQSPKISSSENDNFKQYVGYGYNAASGKAIYENDALMLTNPILDITKGNVKSNINVFSGGTTYTKKYTSTKVTEISEKYGREMCGTGGVGGKISSINAKINDIFDRIDATSWENISNEEYSYYAFFSGNIPVVLQMQLSDIINNLNENFSMDLKQVNSVESATNLYKKYGTHLLTGYTLGGIFELTNYYATNSASYEREQNVSFEAQVSAGEQSMTSSSKTFSFTQLYGTKDNNENATNKYKLSTYGGKDYSGRTIDQAFSILNDSYSSGYLYENWLNSIKNKYNLVITGIPDYSKMIPLWDLMPAKPEFIKTKNYLINAYIKLTDSAYKTYLAENKDKHVKGILNTYETIENTKYDDFGFSYSKLNTTKIPSDEKSYIRNYVDASELAETDIYKLDDNSLVNMDYDRLPFEGHKNVWSICDVSPSDVDASLIEVVDSYNGTFKINTNTSSKPVIFTFKFTSDGKEFFKRSFIIDSSMFSGGDGSEQSPYLIGNARDFKELVSTTNDSFWKNKLYFKLISDIDLTFQDIPMLGGKIETNKNTFNGVFDGNNHVIFNLRTNSSLDSTQALFSINLGVIKNLTIDYYNTDILKKHEGEEATLYPTINVYNGETFVAGIAGLNGSSGIIENCRVKNLHIQYNNNPSNLMNPTPITNPILPGELLFGGITAYSTGTISNCSISNSSFNIRPSGKSVDIYAGGIVGKTRSNKTSEDHQSVIQNSQVNNFGAFCTTEELDTTDLKQNSVVNIGGLIGYSFSTNVTNCVVRDLMPVGDGAYPLYLKKNARTTATMGGLIGSVEDTNNVVRCIIDYEDKQINDKNSTVIYGTTADRIKEQIFSGAMIGYVPQGTPISIKDSYCKYNLENETIVGDNKIADVKIHYPEVILKTNLKKENFSIDIINDTNTWYFINDDINVNTYRILESTLKVNTTNAQLKFNVGEEFNSKNVFVEGFDSTNKEFKETLLEIDHSSFYLPDGKLNTTPGTRDIIVKCYGVNLVYQVEVIEPETDRIEVRHLCDGANFVGNTEFDKDSVTVNKISKTGVITEINKTDYDAKLVDSTIKNGTNKAIISFEGHEYVYNFDGIEKEISNIEILNADLFLTKDKTYSVGINDIDFSELQIKVNYKDTNGVKTPSTIVTGKDCEFIYPRISKGENTIIVVYEGIYRQEFKVVGEVKVPIEKVNEFISKVEEIEAATKLTDKFKLINEANALYNVIGDAYEGDATNCDVYLMAKETYFNAIKNYNETINSINNGYNNAVGLATSLNQVGVMNSGFITILAIVAWLFKKY